MLPGWILWLKSRFPLGAILREIHGLLNHALALVEQGAVLLIGLALVYFAWQIAWLSPKQAIKDLSIATPNCWLLIVLVLTPLYFRTIREFLEQVREAFGMKKGDPIQPSGQETSTTPTTAPIPTPPAQAKEGQ